MKPKNITLFHYWRSSCSWRVRWAMNLKKIKPKLVAVNLLQGEQSNSDFLQKNPVGQVPCIEVDGVYYRDSMAILEWLEDVFPEPAILPASPEDKMYVRSLAYIVSSGTQPLQNLGPQKYFSSDPAKQKVYAAHWIEKGLSEYETILKLHKSSMGRCSFGDNVTIADLCLIPQCYNAGRFEVSLDAFPLAKKIFQYCSELESCKNASPDKYQPN